ncbi:hypothetical protein L210DRAFT_989796 [Boletus edulis BED1]|uniref:OCRL-1/2 ASH domain-containing protein n=1 Tax=Boletus edulis BED1 TaxID=1328754 RepID=A0AAD4BGE6_BOLED|nr:hypothetical protein L210DRAFT_989796 [Boletus edulis BED1]
MTILLSAYVDNDSAAKLNVGLAMFECTLILHTALGKDDFISVSGCYQYTCFANTLERLTRLAGPIRNLKSPEELLPAGQAMNAPTEIIWLINWMMTHISATDMLFEYPAQERLCHVIREVGCLVVGYACCLDMGDEFPSEGPDGDHRALVAAFSSTLVALLDSLIEPVVPARLHTQCLQAWDKDEAFEVLSAFPHESINVWISLTAMLHFIAKQGASKDDSNPTSTMRAHRLGNVFRRSSYSHVLTEGSVSVFAPVLLRDDPTRIHPRASPLGKRGFLLRFID